ncbi:MAG: FmdB family zinc ribbon protein [Bacillota bacterium]
MPTYEYHCPQCGKFEYFQSITAEPLVRCPRCSSTVKKLISANGNIVFKGSGFYTTDYGRSKDYRDKVKSEKPENKGEKAS